MILPARPSFWGCLLIICLQTGWFELPLAYAQVATSAKPAIAQAAQVPEVHEFAPTTVLPTDVVPRPQAQNRLSIGQNLQLRAIQRLPARFYLNVSCETSFRDETNPFQYPTKREFIKRFLPPPPEFRELPILQQINELHQLSNANINNCIFRALPSVTAGWMLTQRTRFFGSYFMIRDQAMHSCKVNSTVNSVAYGIQQDIPVPKLPRLSAQAEFQVRSLFQNRQKPVYDFLPTITCSYLLTPRTVVYASTVLQLRGNGYYQCPTRELDPFYSFGSVWQSRTGLWAFSANATFLQNFRHMFGKQAAVPIDNYSWILDFEIARRLFAKLPGLQAFARAEPVYNYHAHDMPGLAGMDFRMYFGLRMSVSKPPLSVALQQIRKQVEELNETEKEPPAPPPPPAEQTKPSAYLMPYQVIAASKQPLHGLLPYAEDNVIKGAGADSLITLSSMHSIKSMSGEI